MELSKLQQKIIDAPYDKIVVMASAASGKTTIMTEKARKLLREGVNPKQMAVITFTNMAASELRQRLGEDYKDGLFVGTIHSLANYFLLSSGVDTGKILNDEKFDKLFELVEKHPNCIKDIDYLILDEAQDTDELQFKFILEMINPSHFFICGDIKQSIYIWRGARPDILLDIMARPDVTVFDMNENYRNGNDILNYAKRIIRCSGLEDSSISMRHIKGSFVTKPYSVDGILSFIRKSNNYKDCAILTRTNKQIELISNILARNNIPFDTFKQGDLSKEDLIKKMSQDTVKVLTVHSAKGLEWNNVLALGMVAYNSEEVYVCYVAATRAKDKLVWMSAPKKQN